jgi:diguanylate cyclase (GGDEF)-like protein
MSPHSTRRVQRLLDTCPDGTMMAMMFLDLDRFKEVNDSFGHEFGDILLCEVAARLRRVIRPDDVIARLGGDEFVIVAHCASGKCAAARIGEKLLDALTAPITIAGQDVIIGASIGISLYPGDGRSKEQLFQAADTAMYRAKAAGRNRYRFFEPGMAVATRERMALETSLRPALARGEFELHYQPRIDLSSMQMVGMEALIRWNHPRRGLVPPAQFIPIAEETGLIAPIGRWVLHEACMQTRRLMTEFKREICVSVNVSARQLAHATFVGEVRHTLQESGIPPHCLELELTESALIADIERTALMLRELRELGVKLAVDDVGTGYSGLVYLRSFPIDVLETRPFLRVAGGRAHQRLRLRQGLRRHGARAQTGGGGRRSGDGGGGRIPARGRLRRSPGLSLCAAAAAGRPARTARGRYRPWDGASCAGTGRRGRLGPGLTERRRRRARARRRSIPRAVP